MTSVPCSPGRGWSAAARRDTDMMPTLLTSLALSAVVLLVDPRTAGAQSVGRGMEGGLDVLSGARSGELAFYVGGFQGNQMVAFRFGARDEHEAIPCSAGIMYE